MTAMQYSTNITGFTPDEIMAFVDTNPSLIEKKIEGKFFVLNYTDKQNSMKEWHPISEICRGIVISIDSNKILKFLIVPQKKFWNCMNIDKLQDTVTISRKFDGSNVNATVIENDNGDPEWLCATRGSTRSPQTIKAKKYLPSPQMKWINTTFAFEFIDSTDLHCETVDAMGEFGLHLINAWITNSETTFKTPIRNVLGDNAIDVLADELGPTVYPVVQQEITLDDLKERIVIKNNPKTRDEVQEGYVVINRTGDLLKVKSQAWYFFDDKKKFPPVTGESVRKCVMDFLKKLNRGDIFNINREDQDSSFGGVTIVTFDEMTSAKDFLFKYLYTDDHEFPYKSVQEDERRKFSEILSCLTVEAKMEIDNLVTVLPEGEFGKNSLGKLSKSLGCFYSIAFKSDVETAESFIANIKASPFFWKFALLKILSKR